jgi:hypothetical protein
MAENDNQGPPVNNSDQANQALVRIQSNVFVSTPAREAAFKKLPGAEPTKLSDTARERVETSLVKAFYPTWKAVNGGVGTVKGCLAFLRTQLQSTGALVSGGFVLRALGAFEFPISANTIDGNYLHGQIHYSDIDIYVSCRNLQKLLPLINAFKPTLYQDRQASLYCNSFLRRNKIRKVYSYHRQKLISITPPYTGLYGKLRKLKETGDKDAIAAELFALEGKTPGLVNSMDIMAVRNKKSPLDVVQNFDLTFCQVWYDGKDVWATHPEHIVERVGYLQGDYVKLFLGKNMFLENRLKKYTKRGFEIRFDPKMRQDIGNSVTFVQLVCKQEVSPRTPDQHKYWAMHVLLNFIVNGNLGEYRTEQDRNKQWGFLEAIPSEGGLLNVAKTFTPTDGYDTDDYDFDTKEPLFEIANTYAYNYDASLDPLTPEEKFYQLACRCLSALYTINRNESPFLDFISTPLRLEYIVHKILDSSPIKPYIDALREGVKREGTDLVFGDEGQLFDFHAHKLNRAVGIDFLDGYLAQNKMIVNKDELPCYLPKAECGKYLTRNDIRPFASLAAYKDYVTTRPPKQMDPLGTLTDFGRILRNVPLATDGWGVINKQTMCPFCLRGEERANGCAYMTHEPPGAYDRAKMPYCTKSEQVKALWDKYKAYQSALPPDGFGRQGLEWCAICGAPCHGHRHFDSQTPGQLKAGVPAAGAEGVDDYGKCPGGGRPEMIARMLAVRAVMLAHKDDAEPNHKAIRREAAFAADAAPRDPALMARADAIFAQEAATRKFNNIGLNEYSMAPAAPPLINNNGNNLPPAGPAGEEAPAGQAVQDEGQAGGSKGTRKRKSSLKKRSRTFKRKGA